MNHAKQVLTTAFFSAAFALIPITAQAVVIYSENFDSATLGAGNLPANWSGLDQIDSPTQSSEFGISQSSGHGATGLNQFAYTRGVNAPASGSDHTMYIAYDGGFTRGSNIRCEFYFWSGIPNGVYGSWADDGAPKGNPCQNMMPCGPWHTRATLDAPDIGTSGALLFTGAVCVIRYWDWVNELIGCDEIGDPWTPPPGSLSAEFHAAGRAAVNRETAVCCRCWLGHTDGLMFEWDSPVVNGPGGEGPGVFYTEKDTRDLGTGNADVNVLIAFESYAGACCYDDISVTDDTKGLLWSENFDGTAPGVDVVPIGWEARNQIGPNHDPGGTGVIQKSEYGIKAQDLAVYQRGTTLGSGSNHTPYVSYDNTFNRGDSLRVTFKAIRGVANNVFGSWADDGQFGPEGLITFNGPWHQLAMRANAMAGMPMIGSGVGPATNEGIIRYWAKPGWGFDQPGDAWTPVAANQVSAGFTDAWFDSLSKDKAICVRVVLGDSTGARLSYRPPGIPDFINESDNRAAAAGPGVGSTATDLILAWATFASSLMIDDVVVETGPLPPTVTPTSTAIVTNTSLPSPTPTSDFNPLRTIFLSEDFEGVGSGSGALPTGWYGHNHDDGAGNTSDFGIAVSKSLSAPSFYLTGPSNHFGYVQGTTLASGSDHTNYYKYDTPFQRGDNLSCTFDVWQGIPLGIRGAWNNEGPPLGGTNNIGIYGPFTTQPGFDAADAGTSGALLFQGTGGGCEACLRYWDWNTGDGSLGFDQPGDPWTPPPGSLSSAFHNAFKVALRAELAMTIRVSLGDSTGASMEWSSPVIDGGNGVGNFFMEKDNRGDAPTTTPPAVGSATEVFFFLTTYAGALCFDNVVVQNDAKGILLNEDFDITTPRKNETPTGWSARHQNDGSGNVSEYGVAAEDHAMYQRGIGPGNSDQGFYHVGYEGATHYGPNGGFDRGFNINVEFMAWPGVYNNVTGSWADHSPVTGEADNVGIFGPWVVEPAITDARNNVSNAILFNGVEAMIRYYDIQGESVGFH